jgi:hypothetical protein
MKQRSGRRYRIVLRGELGDQFQGRFGAMALERKHGLTVLTGMVVDQAQLLLDAVSIERVSLRKTRRLGRGWGPGRHRDPGRRRARTTPTLGIGVRRPGGEPMTQ